MLKMSTAIIATLMLASSWSSAATRTVPGMTRNQMTTLKLNQVDQLYPLVEKYDPATNTMLKMKVTTYNLGGSSDVSNLTEIYLGSFCHTEMKQGGALHLIASVDKVLSVTRIEAGIYRVVVQEWPLGDDWESPVPDFRLRKVAYTINAANLSVELRKLEGIGEGEERQYSTPVYVDRQVLD